MRASYSEILHCSIGLPSLFFRSIADIVLGPSETVRRQVGVAWDKYGSRVATDLIKHMAFRSVDIAWSESVS